ncbi:glycosyltransferase family 2 protein [Desertivirga brevis]|uniref:glycosyltransferase family 2 protein n=1 Tax=Desertivirga brevis TaxID=2810310 RepID=UPI001A966D86|nr:glycosyltransferase family 2 protein [Pedobacter sp. SYSU D00873]
MSNIEVKKKLENTIEGPGLPLISVITVVKNSAYCLERCIQSVVNQEYKNIEHVIVDGESTDGTVEILKKYNESLGYWISEKDTGIYNAMNKAIEFTKGKWLMFLGADDFLLPGFSEFALQLKSPQTIYYGCCLWGNRVLNTEPYTQKSLPFECICHQGILYPRSVFEKYRYNEKYTVAADYYLNIQCWTDKSFGKFHWPFLISNFTQGGFSESTLDEAFENDFEDILKKYLKTKYYLRYRFKKFKKRLKKTKVDD